MKTSFKLFNFQGAPVSISLWFFLLFAFLPPLMVVSVFISVLIHELAHAWMANKRGYNVFRVHIDLLSGSTSIDTNMHDRDLIPIVLAGPLSTLLLSIISFVFNGYIFTNEFIYNMYIINLILFIFNILPIYPMDGGRIIRSIFNLKSKNRRIGRQYANYISLISSIGLLVYFIIDFQIILILLACYFGYIAIKELTSK